MNTYRCWDLDGETHHEADSIEADTVNAAALSFAQDLDFDEIDTVRIGVVDTDGTAWLVAVYVARVPTLHVETTAPYTLPEDDE